MPELFDKRGGFRRLHSFTLATIVQLETLRFCRRFMTQDPRESGYARWLDADDAVIVANAMLIVIGRALNMLKSQLFPDCRGTRPVQQQEPQ